MASTAIQSAQSVTFDISSLECPALTVDHHGRIVSWNTAAEQVLGHAEHTVRGKDVCSTLLDDRLETRGLDARWLTMMSASARRLAHPCREFQVAAASGVAKWMLVSALPAWTATRDRVTIFLMHETTPYHRLAAG